MKQRVWTWAPAITSLSLGAALLATSELARGSYKLLLQEDGPLEWLTAWSFVIAAGVFIATARRHDAWKRRIVPLLLAAFCVFVAGEELSWGQRLLGFQPPEVFLRSNYQQESNLHNFLKGIFDSRWQVFSVAFGYGLLAPLAVFRRWLPDQLAPSPIVVPTMLAVAALELTYPVELTGEVAEMLLGLAFLHDAVCRWREEQPRAGRHASVAMALSCGLGWLMPPLLDATLLRPQPADVKLARTELQALAEQLQKHGQPKLLARRRVHKRVFTAIRAGYLTPQAQSHLDRRSHYHLDPWQQPYWLVFEPRSRTRGIAMLYSFGANRRRDTVIKRVPASTAAMGGDDIAVRVVVRIEQAR